MPDLISYVGILAACCTTGSFVPQVLQILKSKDTAAISVSMYSVFTFGASLWVIYGIVREDFPVFIANLITLMLTLAVLILTLKSRIKTEKD